MFVILCLVLILDLLILNCRGESANNYRSPKFDVIAATSNVTINDTMETQHTICRISSDQIIADAEATVTKVVTGGCNAKVIDDRFKSLETFFSHQLTELKHFIIRIIEKDVNNEQNLIQDTVSNRINLVRIPDYIQKLGNHAIDTSENLISSRQHEIRQFNNTINEIPIAEDIRRVFTYYWRVSDIDEKLLKWKTGRSLRSPTFYIQKTGYAMYMKFTPKYFPDGTIFISVGLTRGVMDHHLIWPFPLKLQIEILDHSPESTRENRRSRVWDPETVCSADFWGQPSATGDADNPECVGLSTARKVVTQNNKFIMNDNILIKLTVSL